MTCVPARVIAAEPSGVTKSVSRQSQFAALAIRPPASTISGTPIPIATASGPRNAAMPDASAVASRGPGDVTAGLTLLSFGSILATAAAPGFLSVLVTNAIRSLSDFAILSTVIGERQKGVPDRLQARVGITGRMIAVCAIAGGGVIGSVLADLVGVRGVFVISGLLVGVAIVLTIPRVRGLDRPDREPTVEL